MTKIMLVEDDNNLREIYEARLLAEGYEIIGAKDGEEALALAVKEKPDLIISDVMMPKISGFDMLDILRSTPETKNTKVIMMTALSQAEDKARADKLGADRYLVKSQVTLEDVARVAREIITGNDSPQTEPTIAPTAVNPPTQVVSSDTATPGIPITNTPTPDPTPPTTVPPQTTTAPSLDTTPPASTPVAPSLPSLPPTQPPPAPVTPVTTDIVAPTVETEKATMVEHIDQFIAQPTPTVPDEQSTASAPTPTTPPSNDRQNEESSLDDETEISGFNTTAPIEQITVKSAPPDPDTSTQISESPNISNESTNIPSTRKKVIEPINDINEQKANLDELLAKEEALTTNPPATDSAAPVVLNNPPTEQTITPDTNDSDDAIIPHQPGNVITPGNNSADLAL